MKTRIRLFILFVLAVCFALSLHAWAGESYTVEFTYGDSQYVLGGGESVPLVDIMDALGLSGKITAVTVSDTALFSVSDGGERIVTSHRPFDTAETMTVTLGGNGYEIAVTDKKEELHYVGADGSDVRIGEFYNIKNGDDDNPNLKWNDGGGYNEYAIMPNENVTYNRRIDIKDGDDVILILCDGATLTIKGGIHVGPDSSLSIYCQKGGTGKLIIPEALADSAGIGGNCDEDCGTVTVYGGCISVSGGIRGAGIGGGYACNGGTVKIYGGFINTVGGILGAGIGGGNGGNGGNITISGGNVTAQGGINSAGIGGGYHGGVGTIRITYGTVKAIGGVSGSGIGGRYGGTVIIDGGMITAVGGDCSAGIGGSEKGYGADVIINGGIVIASGHNSPTIGHGKDNTDNGTLTLGNEPNGIYIKVGIINDNKVTWESAEERENICRSLWKTVRIERCSPHIEGAEGECLYCGYKGNFVHYVDAKGEAQPAVACEEITSKLSSWNDGGLNCGWYAVKGTVTIDSRVKVSGNVNLILCDGASLTVTGGIEVILANSLTIWSQSGGSGKLISEAKLNGFAGIGGNGNNIAYNTCGTVIINGGDITAAGGDNAAGIGGGSVKLLNTQQGGGGGSITINGGSVKAAGKGGAQAIGCGKGYKGSQSGPTLGDVRVRKESGDWAAYADGSREKLCRDTSGTTVIIARCPHERFGGDGVCERCGYKIPSGDVNLDGKVTPLDAMILARYLAGWKGYMVDPYAADIDRDGNVTVRDAVILARHLAGWNGYGTLPYKAN